MVWCEIIQENFPSIFVTHKVKVSLIQLIKLNILFLLCIYEEIFYFLCDRNVSKSCTRKCLAWLHNLKRNNKKRSRNDWIVVYFYENNSKKELFEEKMNLVKVNYWGFLYIIKPDVIRKYDNNLNKIKPDLCRGKKHQR